MLNAYVYRVFMKSTKKKKHDKSRKWLKHYGFNIDWYYQIWRWLKFWFRAMNAIWTFVVPFCDIHKNIKYINIFSWICIIILIYCSVPWYCIHLKEKKRIFHYVLSRREKTTFAAEYTHSSYLENNQVLFTKSTNCWCSTVNYLHKTKISIFFICGMGRVMFSIWDG